MELTGEKKQLKYKRFLRNTREKQKRVVLCYQLIYMEEADSYLCQFICFTIGWVLLFLKVLKTIQNHGNAFVKRD